MAKSPMTSKSWRKRSDWTTMFMASYVQERFSRDWRLYERYRTSVFRLPVVYRFKYCPSSIPFPGVRWPNKSPNLNGLTRRLFPVIIRSNLGLIQDISAGTVHIYMVGISAAKVRIVSERFRE